MDRRQFPARAFWERSSTGPGQLAGLAMIMLPALTNPVPVGPALHASIQVLAVLVGFAGAVIVFGGLVYRVFVKPSGRPPEEMLAALPYARAVWWSTLALTVLLAAGVEWRFVLIFTDDWGEHLPEVIMLALPAAGLSWVTWRARAMRGPAREDGASGAGPGEPDETADAPTDEPAEPTSPAPG